MMALAVVLDSMRLTQIGTMPMALANVTGESSPAIVTIRLPCTPTHSARHGVMSCPGETTAARVALGFILLQTRAAMRVQLPGPVAVVVGAELALLMVGTLDNMAAAVAAHQAPALQRGSDGAEQEA